MLNNEKHAHNLEKAEQRRQKIRVQEVLELEKERKINTRRKIIIGELVLESFPELLLLKPHFTKDENYYEFAPLQRFIKLLATKKVLFAQLKAKAYQNQ